MLMGDRKAYPSETRQSQYINQYKKKKQVKLRKSSVRHSLSIILDLVGIYVRIVINGYGEDTKKRAKTLTTYIWMY